MTQSSEAVEAVAVSPEKPAKRPYRVLFEYRRPGGKFFEHEIAAGAWQQHSGHFEAETAAQAKNAIFGQLRHMGYEPRGFAVYDGEVLVMGMVLSKEV